MFILIIQLMKKTGEFRLVATCFVAAVRHQTSYVRVTGKSFLRHRYQLILEPSPS